MEPLRHLVSLYVIIAVLVVALVALLVAYVYERRRTKGVLENLKHELDCANSRLKKLPSPISASADKLASSSPSPVSVSASSSFEGIFGGKALYEALVSGSSESITHWSNVDTGNFIEYYRLQHREFVDSLDTDYNNLSRNHKVFMVLLDMGKTDPEIQKLMGITQTTIRSIRFRIKAKRKGDNEPEDTQTTIQF